MTEITYLSDCRALVVVLTLTSTLINRIRIMQSSTNSNLPTFLAFSLLPLSGFATDIYIPSMPQMAKDLNASTLDIQLTLGLFVVFYGIAQLFIGSFLDSFGRYRPSLIALVIFLLSCLVLANCENIYVMFTMRVIHGITVAVVVVAKRAYFVDIFSGKKLNNYLSMFTIIWSAGPILAPFLGGFLEEHYGWRANFYFLAFYAGVVIMLEVLYSGETLKAPRLFHVKSILSNYSHMLRTADFTMGIGILMFSYSTVMVYNLTGAFMIENHYHQGPVTIGNCSLVMGLAWMAGGLLAKSTLRYSFYKKIAFNISLQLALVVASLLWAYFFNMPILVFVVFAFLIHTCAGFNYNNYFSRCLSRFPERAGTAGGLTGGAVNMAMSLLTYAIVTYLPADTPADLAVGYLVPILASAALFIWIHRLQIKESRKTSNQSIFPACQS